MPEPVKKPRKSLHSAVLTIIHSVYNSSQDHLDPSIDFVSQVYSFCHTRSCFSASIINSNNTFIYFIFISDLLQTSIQIRVKILLDWTRSQTLNHNQTTSYNLQTHFIA